MEPMSASCSASGSAEGAIVGEGKTGVGRIARPGATIGPAVGAGVGVRVGVRVGVKVGSGVGVGTGDAVGMGVAVGSGVDVGTGDAVGVAVGVRVGVGIGDGEGVELGGTGVGSGCEQLASRSSRTIRRGKNLTVAPLSAGCPV